MSGRILNKSVKRRISEKTKERAETVEQLVDGEISTGYTIPSINKQRLQEPKEYDLSVVFIDITGFSNYVIDNTEKEVLYMLGIFIPAILETVREFDGYFEKNTGDGVLAYFGFRENRQESVEKLLDYLATVKWTLANHVNPILTNNGIDPVSISAGATYGKTHLQRIGIKSGKQSMNNITAVSEAVNRASKLEAMSKENEYLVGPSVKYHSDPAGWGSRLEIHDIFEDYTWEPSNKSSETSDLIYDFKGNWEDTNESQLTV
jgi:class 3 adenylate cyclase